MWRLVPLVVRQLEVVVHLDGVERAVLGAQPAVHADVHVDVEVLGERDHGPLGALGLAHPDALGRADLRADVARGAADVAVLGVVDQHGQDAEPLVDRQPLVGILDREQPGGLVVLQHGVLLAAPGERKKSRICGPPPRRWRALPARMSRQKVSKNRRSVIRWPRMMPVPTPMSFAPYLGDQLGPPPDPCPECRSSGRRAGRSRIAADAVQEDGQDLADRLE